MNYHITQKKDIFTINVLQNNINFQLPKVSFIKPNYGFVLKKITEIELKNLN